MAILSTVNKFIKELKLIKYILTLNHYYRWLSCIPSNIPTLIKTKSLGTIDDAFGQSFTVKWAGKQIKFEKLGFGVVREIYGHCCYAKPGDLKNTRHILDLGANGGAFSLFALTEAPHAQVYAVEVQAEMVQVLQVNAKNNRYSERLTVETAVVGGFHNKWTEEQHKKNPELHVFSIHDYIKRVGNCDFLKCDVEGGEFLLFQGDLSWTDAVQAMAIEYHPDWGDVDELERILKNQGFHVRKVDHNCLGYFYCSRI